MVRSEPNIICGVDPSSEAGEAFARACTLAKDGGNLHLIHVVSAVSVPSEELFDQNVAWVNPGPGALRDADRLLQSRADDARRAGVKRVTTAKVVSDRDGSEGVALALSDAVKEAHADKVVLGSRGMDSVSRTLLGALGLGSVSEYAASHVDCSVEVVGKGGHVRQLH